MRYSMECKKFRRELSGLIVLQARLLPGLDWTNHEPVMKAGVSAEVWVQHLLITSLQRYRQINLLSNIIFRNGAVQKRKGILKHLIVSIT
jgi:hypothetical protein